MFKILVTGQTVEEVKDKIKKMSDSFSSEVNVRHLNLSEVTQDESRVEETKSIKTEVENSTVVQSHSALDKDGVPWDSRIHASSRKINADGTWKKAKGIDINLYQQVMNELKQKQMAANQILPAPPVPTAAVHIPKFDSSQSETIQKTAAVEPVKSYENLTLPSAPQGGKPVHSFETFKANFVQILPALTQKHPDVLTQDYLNECAAYFKVQQIWQILSDDKKLKEFFEGLVDQGFITKI